MTSLPGWNVDYDDYYDDGEIEYNIQYKTVTAPVLVKDEDGGYDYEFIKPGPSEDCICAICHLVARNAQQSSCCGKIFCEVCINRLKDSSWKVNCPNCRQNFQYFKDIRTNREIQSLKIYCTNHTKGCLWEDELNKVEEHIKTCPYQIIECKKKCEQKIQRQLMKAHLANECPNRDVTCIHCKETGTWAFINGNHFEVCPDHLLPCPNTGCEKQVKRQNLKTHQEACPKRIVPCPFLNVGCELTFKNEDIAKHKQEHVEKHLSLAVEKIEKLEIQQKTSPLVLKIEKFDGSNPVRSSPFYTSKGGYKMSLLVKPNGFQEYGKKWVSCSIDLMPGEYDNTLEWPFQGEVTVELLNQLQNNNHRQHTVNYSETLQQDVYKVRDEEYQYYGSEDEEYKEYEEKMDRYQHTEDEEYEEYEEYEGKMDHYQHTENEEYEGKMNRYQHIEDEEYEEYEEKMDRYQHTEDEEYEGKMDRYQHIEDEEYEEYEEKMDHYQHTEQAVCKSNKKNEQQFGKIEEISKLISHDDLGLESVQLTQGEAIPTSSMSVGHYKTTHTNRKPTYNYPNYSYTSSEYEEEEIVPFDNVQFLVNGTLYLRVNVQTHSQTKPWLY